MNTIIGLIMLSVWVLPFYFLGFKDGALIDLGLLFFIFVGAVLSGAGKL